MNRIVYIFNYTTIILPREREIDFNCESHYDIYDYDKEERIE